MIPVFPEFKKIELSDKGEVEKMIQRFLPYSDFNFVSMWAWDIKGQTLISQLNGNLVVRFTDYMTGELFYSFLGDQQEDKTVEDLFLFLKKQNLPQRLKLISEEICHRLSKDKFDLIPDQDSCDYVYSVFDLANMNNWTQNSSGKSVRSFVKNNPCYTIKHYLLREVQKDEFIEIFKKWSRNKGTEDYSKTNEYIALNRVFEIKDENLKAVLMYVDGLLVGFTIYEILHSSYAISHFAKTDTEHEQGIGNVLNWEEAKILNAQGVKFFNWEQDLGIVGLRKSKEKYKPLFLFKKLIVGSKT